jgi:hypothetical protein
MEVVPGGVDLRGRGRRRARSRKTVWNENFPRKLGRVLFAVHHLKIPLLSPTCNTNARPYVCLLVCLTSCVNVCFVTRVLTVTFRDVLDDPRTQNVFFYSGSGFLRFLLDFETAVAAAGASEEHSGGRDRQGQTAH